MVAEKVREQENISLVLQEEMAFRIEEVQNKAEMAYSLQMTLFTAFYCQEQYSFMDFKWAFFLLGELTGDVSDELKELTENAFEIMRKGYDAGGK